LASSAARAIDEHTKIPEDPFQVEARQRNTIFGQPTQTLIHRCSNVTHDRELVASGNSGRDGLAGLALTHLAPPIPSLGSIG
jgi:hypothetical protein